MSRDVSARAYEMHLLMLTYRVLLCRRFNGDVWFPIRSGIHYNVSKLTVEPLLGVPTYLAVP